MRIAKYLASCGLGSRRKCEDLVQSGKITLNGKIITTPALNIDPSLDVIAMAGKVVKPLNEVYYLLNKPTGYTSSVSDAHADKLVTELVPAEPPVWPVGRLDRETSGLLIMTNDGELTQKLTHPRYLKEKEYLLTVDRPLRQAEISALRKGINLEDGPFKPDKFEETGPGRYRIVIHEGRNRLIRRAISHFSKEITALSRVRMADIEIKSLELGKYRVLTKNEVTRLKNA